MTKIMSERPRDDYIPTFLDSQGRDELLIDVFSYIKHYAPDFQDSSTFEHLSGLAQTIKVYWDDLPTHEVLVNTRNPWHEKRCQNLVELEAWSQGFSTGTGDMTTALKALAASMSNCTLQLIQLNTALSNSIVLARWKLLALNRLKGHARTRSIFPEYSSEFVINTMGGHSTLGNRVHAFDRKIAIGLWRDLQDCAKDLTKNNEYKTFALKVADFCLRAGCPAVTQNPLDNISTLRAHLTRGSAAEIELRKELEQLRKLTLFQQRIITNLTFRHLLEMLPPPPSSKSSSATARWKSFFTSAIRNAEAQQVHETSNHPLLPLLRKHPKKVKEIEHTGGNLYGVLSTNIHHFQGEFEIGADQWNQLEGDILRALTPLDQNRSDAGVEWDEERRRFQSTWNE